MKSKIALRLQIFTLFISACMACFMPFQQFYFSGRNLTYTQTGIVFGISALVSMLMQPVWGYIADNYLSKKKTIYITIIGSLSVILFFIPAQGFIPVLLLICVNSIFIYAIFPLIDAYTFDVVAESSGLSFSHIKFMASIGYAIPNLMLGYVVKYYGINIIFVAYAVLGLLGLLIIYNIDFEGERKPSAARPLNIASSLKSPKILIFFVTLLFMNIAIIGGTNYMNSLIEYNHGDVSNLGMVGFITCVFEVITFYFVGKMMKKIGIINVYSLSMLIYISRFVMDYLCKTARLIVAVQLLEGIAYTLFITSSLEYLNRNTSAELRGSAIGIYAAIGGLGNFAAGLFGGFALNMVTPSQLYAVFAAFCLAALALSRKIMPNNHSAINVNSV